MTQGEVSDSTGISVSHISACERGERNLSQDAQQTIAEFYKVEVESILEFSEEFHEKKQVLCESPAAYYVHGLEAIRAETLEALAANALECHDWPAVKLFAEELTRREGAK